MACQATRGGSDSLEIKIGVFLPPGSLLKAFLPFTPVSQLAWCLQVVHIHVRLLALNC